MDVADKKGVGQIRRPLINSLLGCREPLYPVTPGHECLAYPVTCLVVILNHHQTMILDAVPCVSNVLYRGYCRFRGCG